MNCDSLGHGFSTYFLIAVKNVNINCWENKLDVKLFEYNETLRTLLSLIRNWDFSISGHCGRSGYCVFEIFPMLCRLTGS